MNPCIKTHRGCTSVELIGKVGGKLEGKDTQATCEDHHLCVVKYSADY